MHVLDDPHCLSPRAQAFLKRAGSRQPDGPTDFSPVWPGHPTSAPTELIVRRGWFAERFGGLCYDVRRSVRIDGVRYDVRRRWRFELLDDVRASESTFEWYGEHVASPVSYLVHSDGRFGVSAGGPFIEVCSSVNQLIESHALMDQVSVWEPQVPSALEPWVPVGVPTDRLREILDRLPVVVEASGPCESWRCSDDVAVRLFHAWTDARPRSIGVMMWTRTGDPWPGQ